MQTKKYYAVRRGRKRGIYETWDECANQVLGYSGAVYKSFLTKNEAIAYIRWGGKADKQQTAPASNPDEKMPYAFVDGSYNSQTGVYGYGGFLCANGQQYTLQGAGEDLRMAKMRNVAGEICGAMAAVRKAEEIGLAEMVLYYDYEGIEAWARGFWQANLPETKMYADFMRDSARTVSVAFVHVKGHSGIQGNEAADALAKAAVGL